MSKRKFYFRRFSSPNGFGLTLFRLDRLNPWRPYFVLSYRPRQRRLLLRLPRRLVGLSWWPPRFWNAAALLAERRAANSNMSTSGGNGLRFDSAGAPKPAVEICSRVVYTKDVPQRTKRVAIWVCSRCGYEWQSEAGKPLRCAGCKTPYWDRPKPTRPYQRTKTTSKRQT